jgi:hypothetical protein
MLLSGTVGILYGYPDLSIPRSISLFVLLFTEEVSTFAFFGIIYIFLS